MVWTKNDPSRTRMNDIYPIKIVISNELLMIRFSLTSELDVFSSTSSQADYPQLPIRLPQWESPKLPPHKISQKQTKLHIFLSSHFQDLSSSQLSATPQGFQRLYAFYFFRQKELPTQFFLWQHSICTNFQPSASMNRVFAVIENSRIKFQTISKDICF